MQTEQLIVNQLEVTQVLEAEILPKEKLEKDVQTIFNVLEEDTAYQIGIDCESHELRPMIYHSRMNDDG